ncbi:hypothetical protein [Methylobacterium sp. sgz302541]|uniref:hypothetical protein n=1 Tax=unclassified Methylobacterium TaxID=2615210 RepID=UPI003D3494FF
MRGDDKQDFTLRPDPRGEHDPIGAGPSDASLRPDPAGEHDRFAHADRTVDAAARDVADEAQHAASRVADLAEQARRKAAGLADDARDYAAGRIDAARERTADAIDDARSWVSETHDEQRRRVAHLARRGQARIDRSRGQVERFVEENPLLVGVVGVAAGLLLGALIPRTRSEDRSIGPYADELRAQGLHYAREATHRGRVFVETALDPDNINAAAGQALHPDEEPGERTLHRL